MGHNPHSALSGEALLASFSPAFLVLEEVKAPKRATGESLCRELGGSPGLPFSTCPSVGRTGGSLLHKSLPRVSGLEVLALAKATHSANDYEV